MTTCIFPLRVIRKTLELTTRRYRDNATYGTPRAVSTVAARGVHIGDSRPVRYVYVAATAPAAGFVVSCGGYQLEDGSVAITG